MKKYFLLFVILIMSNPTWAQELNCQIQVNFKVILQNKVKTRAGQKTLIGQSTEVTAYVTEKENHLFTVEAFLTDYEARLYAEGFMKQKTDSIKASLWGRDSLIEINCSSVE